MNSEKFKEDLERLTFKLGNHLRLVKVKERLLELRSKGLVKSNHSALEVLLADYLCSKGFEVTVEYPLSEDLICDIYAKAGDEDLIVEVETGFVPPQYSLDPRSYNLARTISKVARYSRFSKYFGLATPVFFLLQLHPSLLKSPHERELEEALELKSLCDRYYKRPFLKLDDILASKVDVIYVLDIDELKVQELSPMEYYRTYLAPLSRNNGWSFRARCRSPGPL